MSQDRVLGCSNSTCPAPGDGRWHHRRYDQIEETEGRMAADEFDRSHESIVLSVNGMPRHAYVADTYPPHEDGTNCWFEWRHNGHLARCRSSLADHEQLGWED